MNKIIRQHYPAEKSPPELREGLAPLCKRDLSQQRPETDLDLLVESEAIQLAPVTRDVRLGSAEMRCCGEGLIVLRPTDENLSQVLDFLHG